MIYLPSDCMSSFKFRLLLNAHRCKKNVFYVVFSLKDTLFFSDFFYFLEFLNSSKPTKHVDKKAQR